MMPRGSRIRIGDRLDARAAGRAAAIEDWPRDWSDNPPAEYERRRTLRAAWLSGYHFQRRVMGGGVRTLPRAPRLLQQLTLNLEEA